MRRALVTALAFTALAVVTASIAGRVARPPVTGLLVAVAVAATVAGGAGALRRRTWPLSLILLPLGAYLLARLQIGLPDDTTGVGAHLAFYAGRIADGSAAYARQTFPLDPGTADLRLVLALTVYVVVGVSAFLALSLRRPLAGIVVLLCLAGLGFTVDGAGREPWRALAFVVLAAGLLTLSHPLPRTRVRLADALAGGLTAVAAVVLALSVLGVTTVEASRPLRDWRTWDLIGPGNTLMRFDWMQNYPRLLARANDAKVMEVRSPVASYWRANVLSVFTGSSWFSQGTEDQLTPSLEDGSWTYDVPQAESREVPGRTVTQRFEVSNTFTDHLFFGGRADEVRSPVPLDLSTSSNGAVSVTPARGPTTRYEVTAFVPDLGASDLIGRGTAYPWDIASAYLQLPFPARGSDTGPDAQTAWLYGLAQVPAAQEWSGLYRLNESAVGSETDPYRIALAIQSYLRSDRFRYSLRPPASAYSSPYAAFLFDTRTGYCQQFAGAMALLLRFNGIPARVVVGFTQGTQERPGVFLVRRNDAHAWVEAYFPGAGWAQFEPTPGRALPAGADGASTTAGAAGSAAGTAGQADTPVRDLPGRARVNDPGGPGASDALVTLQTGSRLPWLIVPVALLVAWPIGRALLRRRGRFASSDEARLRAAVGSLYDTLADHGVRVPASQTLDETVRLLKQRLGFDLQDVATRVQAVTFGGLEVTVEDVQEVRRFRRRLAAHLRSREGLLQRLGALYGLRRMRPLVPEDVHRPHPRSRPSRNDPRIIGV